MQSIVSRCTVFSMTRDQLLNLLNAPEDAYVERKADGNTREVRKTACAFANTMEDHEGVLFIGVHDRSGRVIGVEGTDSLQKTIRAALEDCYPPIKHTAVVLEVEGKYVVAIVIPPSDQKPHFTGAAYVRVGSESVAASPQQLDELVASRNDKCRQILKLKGKGPVTVRAIGYKLGSNKRLADSHYVEGAECVVMECNAQVVRLHNSAAGVNYSESVERVDLGWDEVKNRTMLIVRGP
jgi:hypothetical protein